MSEADDKFVHFRNVENFKRQLRGVLTDGQRRSISALLAEAEERAVQAGWTPKVTRKRANGSQTAVDGEG